MDDQVKERGLVDMDGVLADFYGGATDSWRRENPHEFFIPTEEINYFFLKEGYPKHLQERVADIYMRKGFFLNLRPIPGAIEGLTYLLRSTEEIRLCTSPIPDSLFCVEEKCEWTRRYFGAELADSIIFTQDKTIISGEYLIDDRAEIPGAQTPLWEHILFAAPHNRYVTTRFRHTWSDVIQRFTP